VERQEQFKGLYQDWDYKVALGGRGRGASVAFAQALHHFADDAFIKVICLREYQNSIAESSKAQLEEVITLEGATERYKITDNYIENKYTGSYFVFKGMAIKPKSLKSLTGFNVAWIEECETMSQASYDILDPTIRASNSEMWLSGNTYSRSCTVAQMFVENPPPPNTWLTHNTYLQNNFASSKMIAQADHMRIHRPDMYRHVWLGEYLNESAVRMIQRYNIDTGMDCFDNWKVVIGCDIARDGGDKTVLMIRRGKKIIDTLRFDSMNLDNLVEQLRKLIAKYRPDRINVDSTGHGAWVPDALRSLGITVKAINFSEGSTDDRYSNRRTELYGMADDYFKAGGVIANDPQLIEEIEASTWHPDNKNRQAMDSKDDIKRRIGRSPDTADAFVLTLPCDGDMIVRESRILKQAQDKIAMSRIISAGSF
jgi:phage terminase large subunit